MGHFNKHSEYLEISPCWGGRRRARDETGEGGREHIPDASEIDLLKDFHLCKAWSPKLSESINNCSV